MKSVDADMALCFVRGSKVPCTKSTLRSWVHRGNIRQVRRGWYDLASIADYLKSRRRTVN